MLVPEPEDPVRNGYWFAGWYTADGTLYDFETPVTEDFVLTARWRAESITYYTVTFDLNEPEGAGSAFLDGGTSRQIAAGGKITDATPTLEGYEFVGWYTADGTKTPFDTANTSIISDITLIAEWEIVDSVFYHVVTMDGKDIDGVSAPAGSADIETVDEPPVFEYDETSYTFVGWSSSETGFSEVSFPCEISGHIHLYAVLVRNSVTDENYPGIRFDYDSTENGYIVSSDSSNPAGKISIPAKIEGVPVVAIAESAFENNTDLISVDLSSAENLRKIGSRAFYKCKKLESIDIENTKITIIDEKTFLSCESLESINIPSGVKTIGIEAFRECKSLSSVTIPDTVETIEYGAFNQCLSLTSVTIPGSVTTIEWLAFYGCKSLESIDIESTQITIINLQTFDSCESLKSIDIPRGVKTIGRGAFQKCTSLSSVTIPDTVETIGNEAFYVCSSLTEVTIPSSVKYVGEWGFGHCDNLVEINVATQTRPGWHGAWRSGSLKAKLYYNGVEVDW